MNTTKNIFFESDSDESESEEEEEEEVEEEEEEEEEAGNEFGEAERERAEQFAQSQEPESYLKVIEQPPLPSPQEPEKLDFSLDQLESLLMTENLWDLARGTRSRQAPTAQVRSFSVLLNFEASPIGSNPSA